MVACKGWILHSMRPKVFFSNQWVQHMKVHILSISRVLTCCMATCGWEAMCCWGLRTPAAYLYWGMVRTGAAVAEAPVGRWPRAWVAEVRRVNKRWAWQAKEQNKAYYVFSMLKYLRIRCEAIIRGTWVLAVAVGRMVLKVWGLGADGRMALGMFWKSEGRGNIWDHQWSSWNSFLQWFQLCSQISSSDQTVSYNHMNNDSFIQLSTYAEDALLEWPNGGWGEAGPTGWQSSMQHDFGPEKDEDRFIISWSLPK